MPNPDFNLMRAPYFVFERAGSETAFDVMRQTGPRSSIDVLPNFKAKSAAERVANALNQAYTIGKREEARSLKLKKSTERILIRAKRVRCIRSSPSILSEGEGKKASDVMQSSLAGRGESIALLRNLL